MCGTWVAAPYETLMPDEAEVEQFHPENIPQPPLPLVRGKNCLPRYQSPVPKRLGIAATKELLSTVQPQVDSSHFLSYFTCASYGKFVSASGAQ